MDLSQIEIYKYFFSAAGREEIKTEIRQYQQTHGKKWLKQFKNDFPDLTFIIDLIANHTAPDAFSHLKEFIAGELDAKFESVFVRIAAKSAVFGFLETNKPSVYQLHSELRAEIDRKQF